jgi:predicted DNA binding CopG/RHH family protein
LGARGLRGGPRLAARGAAEPAQSQAERHIDFASLPVSLLEWIKIAAHKRDVPYQPLIKMWLAEKAG